MFRQAEENLLQAKEALRLAQEAYDSLASRRPLRTPAWKRKQLQKRRSLTDEGNRTLRREAERRARKRRLKLREQAQKRAFIYSFGADNSIVQPTDELVSLFQEVGSLDQFAKRLAITRRDAIHGLKAAGFDIVENIAKAWEGGKSLRALSQVHGPTPQTLSKWIKSTGRAIKPRNSNQKYDRARLYELFDDGWTTNKIAMTMKLSWATVQRCKTSWWETKNTQV
ncbi:hypothetical protein R1T40_19245 [Tritonibacter scottomollicae]|uniref:Uncharacterized protein n=1 Tax=Tritonibacter scottomollicae TaxID=483013 RepID=A0ABZ0HHM4_TRISK|nr:hypothetical protein [Tritonibacter scottomollicae]WOI33047.1 hypothetical protein R1T40_19245 [Tritonibacter scottomollicae]